MSKIIKIPIEKIELNTGQIPGVPENPRVCTPEQTDAMTKSIADFREMMELRPILAYPEGDKFVVICGNRRFEACRKLGWKDVPCMILPTDFDKSKIREILIKDNLSYGDWDLPKLTEWDLPELTEWGFPDLSGEDIPDVAADTNELKNSCKEIDPDELGKMCTLKFFLTQEEYKEVVDCLKSITPDVNEAILILIRKNDY